MRNAVSRSAGLSSIIRVWPIMALFQSCYFLAAPPPSGLTFPSRLALVVAFCLSVSNPLFKSVTYLGSDIISRRLVARGVWRLTWVAFSASVPKTWTLFPFWSFFIVDFPFGECPLTSFVILLWNLLTLARFQFREQRRTRLNLCRPPAHGN